MQDGPPKITLTFPFSAPPSMAGPAFQAWRECQEIFKKHDLTHRQVMNVVYQLGAAAPYEAYDVNKVAVFED